MHTHRVDEPVVRLIGTRRRLVDAIVLFLGVIGPTIAVLARHRHDGHRGLAVEDVVALVVFVPLLLARRRLPLEAFLAGAAAAAALTAISGERTAAIPATVLLMFWMTSHTPRERVLLPAIAGTVVLFLAAALRLDGRVFAPDSFAILAWSGAAAAAGDAVRNRRAYVRAIEDRARRAEEATETEARRRVAEERLRIARELHDVVAHQMAVINVQAGVAAHLLDRDPDGARRALTVVRDAGRTVLDEIGGLLDVLRNGDEQGAETSPLPGVRDLDALLRSFQDAGLEVRTSVQGELDTLSPALQLTVHRIVEEALTNAHKHGTGEASLTIDAGRERVEVRVENGIAAPATTAATGRGHGTTGMRERVAAAHGELTAGPDAAGRWLVRAVLPRTTKATP